MATTNGRTAAAAAPEIENPELTRLRENEASLAKSLARMETESKAPAAIANKRATLDAVRDRIAAIEKK